MALSIAGLKPRVPALFVRIFFRGGRWFKRAAPASFRTFFANISCGTPAFKRRPKNLPRRTGATCKTLSRSEFMRFPVCQGLIPGSIGQLDRRAAQNCQCQSDCPRLGERRAHSGSSEDRDDRALAFDFACGELASACRLTCSLSGVAGHP